MKMNTNRQIVEKIRHYGRLRGLVNDNQIISALGSSNVVLLRDIQRLKTAPRIDTLNRFAEMLGVTITDLIYEETAVASMAARQDQLTRDIMAVIDEWLKENRLSLSPENRTRIFEHIYQSGCSKKEQISPLLSAMRLANSGLFLTKGR